MIKILWENFCTEIEASEWMKDSFPRQLCRTENILNPNFKMKYSRKLFLFFTAKGNYVEAKTLMGDYIKFRKRLTRWFFNCCAHIGNSKIKEVLFEQYFKLTVLELRLFCQPPKSYLYIEFNPQIVHNSEAMVKRKWKHMKIWKPEKYSIYHTSF